MRRYHLSLYPSSQLARSITRHFEEDQTLFALNVSYSGYRNEIFSLDSNLDDRVGNRLKYVHVSAYSGALTYNMGNRIYVDHYL
jgi:hypothetical protein